MTTTSDESEQRGMQASSTPSSPSSTSIIQSPLDENLKFVNLKKQAQTAYKTKSAAEIERHLSGAELRGMFATRLERAAWLVVQQIASAESCSKAIGMDESKIRRAAKAFVAGRQPGQVGHPPSLNIRAEADLVAWMETEIQANRDPTVGLVLEKATQLKGEETNSPLEDNPVRQRWLTGFLESHPSLQIKHARSIEEVCLLALCFHLNIK